MAKHDINCGPVRRLYKGSHMIARDGEWYVNAAADGVHIMVGKRGDYPSIRIELSPKQAQRMGRELLAASGGE